MLLLGWGAVGGAARKPNHVSWHLVPRAGEQVLEAKQAGQIHGQPRHRFALQNPPDEASSAARAGLELLPVVPEVACVCKGVGRGAQ